MPEGDTVYRTARRLHEALAGEPLISTDLRWGDLATVDLTGRDTLEVISRGKHILQRIDGGWTVHSHLRMEGSWRIVATATADARTRGRSDLRAVVATARWTCLGLRLGMLDLLPTAEEHRVVGHLGPDLLGPDWDEDEAVRRLLAQPHRPIGAALLDQRNLAGIGTLWDAESLFLERVHPWATVGLLGPQTVTAVVRRAHRLLHANIAHAVQSSTGVRRPGQEVYCHARSGRPCRRCGDTIRVAMIGDPPQERTMFSCPTCQGGLGPTDDGRPQVPLGTRSGRNGSPSPGSPGGRADAAPPGRRNRYRRG